MSLLNLLDEMLQENMQRIGSHAGVASNEENRQALRKAYKVYLGKLKVQAQMSVNSFIARTSGEMHWIISDWDDKLKLPGPV
jgi:hypothetical protein